jgi:hypothetical protein
MWGLAVMATGRGSLDLWVGRAHYLSAANSSCPLPERPPLWSRAQTSWLPTQMSWVRFPALPDFLSSNGSETGVHSAS